MCNNNTLTEIRNMGHRSLSHQQKHIMSDSFSQQNPFASTVVSSDDIIWEISRNDKV